MKALLLTMAGLLIAGMCSGQGVVNGPTRVDAQITSAANKWKAQREGVVTGKCLVRLFRYRSAVHKHRIDVKAFRPLVEQKDIAALEKALVAIKSMRGETYKTGFQPLWDEPIEITCEGIKWRNEWKTKPAMIFTYNGDESAEYIPGISQATIIPGRPNTTAFTLESLCCLPSESVIKEVLSGRSITRQDGEVSVDIPSGRITFDPLTGFVSLYAVFSSAKARDKLTEIRQIGPMRLEGGFVYPQARVYVEYEGNHVRSFDVFLIDKAELNLAIPPETFTVSAPKQTLLVDMRGKTQYGPPRHRVVEDVPDVLAYANSGALKLTPPDLELPEQSRGRFRWQFGLLTLSIVILGSWYIVRYRKRKAIESND